MALRDFLGASGAPGAGLRKRKNPYVSQALSWLVSLKIDAVPVPAACKASFLFVACPPPPGSGGRLRTAIFLRKIQGLGPAPARIRGGSVVSNWVGLMAGF